MKKLVKKYKALSDINRLRILKMLEKRSLCVCEITSILNLATSTVSKHLTILRDSEFIVDYKEGKWVNFHLNDDPDALFVKDILTQISGWVNDDPVVQADLDKVNSVDRYAICGLS